MQRSAIRAATLAIAAAGVVGIYGCSEKLEGGAGCPILCPGQNVELRDTLIAAVALDTVLSSYPAIGREPTLLLTSRGDTLQTRIIVRFDTLPTTYTAAGNPATPIDFVANARMKIRLAWPPLNANQSVTIDAYDVDTTAVADTLAETMLPLFRPDRFLGSITFTPQQVADNAVPGVTAPVSDTSLRVPINDAYVLAKIQARARLRVGLLIRAAESAELRFIGIDQGRPDSLLFNVTAGDNPTTRGTGPYSATPSERFIADDLGDFVIVAQRRPSDAPPEVLTVGGIPGRRSYLRFELPSGIVDSTSVVRATLELTQYPNRLAFLADDTISLYPQAVVASPAVTDLQKAASLLSAPTSFRVDSLRIPPNDSGKVEIEVVGLVQVWRASDPDAASRAIVLRLPTEGTGQNELYFFSTEAAESLRPRLRIVYVPRVGFGLP